MKIALLVAVFFACIGMVPPTLYVPAIVRSIEEKLHPELSHDDITAATARMDSIMDGVSALLGIFFLPVSGVLSDRIGRKPVILASILSSLLGSVAVMLAYQYKLMWLMFVANFIGSWSTIFPYSTASAFMNDICGEGPDKAKYFGYITAAIGVAMIVGPLGFGIFGKLGITTIFIFGNSVLLITFVAILIFLKESLHYNIPHPDNNKVSINDYEARETTLWQKINPFYSWGVLFTRKNPFLTTLAVVYMFYSLASSDVLDTEILYTNVRYGWTASNNALVMALTGLIVVIFQGGLLVCVVRVLGEKRLLVFSLLAAAGVRVGFVMAFNQWLFILFLSLSAAADATGPAMTALLSRCVERRDMGAAISAAGSVTSLCQFFGALAMENIFAYFISSRAPFYFPSAQFVICAILLLISATITIVLFAKYKNGAELKYMTNTEESTPILYESPTKHVLVA